MFPCISCLAGGSGTGERVCCFRYFRSSWGIFFWNHAWLKPSSLGKMFVCSQWPIIMGRSSFQINQRITKTSFYNLFPRLKYDFWELFCLLTIDLFKNRNFEDNFSVNHKPQFVVYSNEWPNLDILRSLMPLTSVTAASTTTKVTPSRNLKICFYRGI